VAPTAGGWAVIYNHHLTLFFFCAHVSSMETVI
jgi:hypothetical protein